MNAIISNISVEPGKNNILRFVISLAIPGDKPTYEFFGTPLDDSQKAVESRRINVAQMRNAFPDLMGVSDPIRHMLRNRSKFVARKVEISVEDQLKDGVVVINERTGQAYHNVRLLPSHEDLTEEQVNALLNSVMTLTDVQG
jgi:hypothetical protein